MTPFPLVLQGLTQKMRVVDGKRSSPLLLHFLHDYCYLVSNCSIEQFHPTVNLPKAPFKSHSSYFGGEVRTKGLSNLPLSPLSLSRSDPLGLLYLNCQIAIFY